ncbi:MAG: CocE/NonD family hydrolase [Vicinamibacterales bacterium]
MTFRHALLARVLLLVAAASLTACTPPPPASGVRHDVDVAVPMRDGIVLRAEVLRPAAEGRYPTLVYRTPYGAHSAVADYTTFSRAAERGYAVVVQDVRGRYRSDGEFRPYEHDGRDGFDTIEWAAAQPWSDGNVGTFGLSYPGAVQWLAAMERPPHLKAMVPAMTFSTPQNFFYTWGVWDMSWVSWIWFNIAPDARARKNLPGPRTDDEVQAGWPAVERKMRDTLPLDAFNALNDVAPYYSDWLRHPPEDPFWDFAELRGRYARTDAAVLNLSGWHDDNYGPEGATTNFMGLVQARGGQPTGTSLLIGPWVHGVGATARTRAGDREFGPDAAIQYDEVVLGWMDRHLRGMGADRPADPPVRYFVMGANVWKTADAWPPPARPVTYTLTAAASRRPGTLAPAPHTPSPKTQVPSPKTQDPSPTSTFVSDPDNPVLNPYDSAGAHDYRALADRDDLLTFDSAPFEADTEVTGPIVARLFVSCDCRDTDIWARLYDVAPDGTAFNLMSPGLDVLRASYRDMTKGRQLLTPGEIYELTLDHLVTSNVFKRGHRVRLQVSASFFPNFSRNLHTGDLETTSSRRQRATIRIHHAGARASQLVLPVVEQ